MPDHHSQRNHRVNLRVNLRGAPLLMAALLLGAAGCGQKGPLYLPETNPPQPQGECPDKRCQSKPDTADAGAQPMPDAAPANVSDTPTY